MSYKIKFGRIRGILMDNKQLNIYEKTCAVWQAN